MPIRISVEYKTRWGETLMLRQGESRKAMSYRDPGIWEAEIDRRKGRYTFELWNDGQLARKEWRGHHPPLEGCRDVLVRNRWVDTPEDAPFYSDFFKNVIFHRKDEAPAKEPRGWNIRFYLPSPQVRPGMSVAITGSGALFDDWKKVIPLDGSAFPYWKISLKAEEAFEYKFLIIDKASLKPLVWEEGDNRFFGDIPGKGSKTIIADQIPSFPLQPWRGTGTAVPIFSLRSKDDFGIGEFKDLKRLVDWASASGQNVIQVLPINDTTMTRTKQDSYPYNSVSAFALHPQFINLQDAGVKADKNFKALAKELNSLPSVDYERVNKEKERLLRKAYTTFKGGADYDSFVKENSEWLLPYAVFCCLRDTYGNAYFPLWGEYSRYSSELVEKYRLEHPKETGFYLYEQYLLDRQLKEACEYAHSRGVCLKGDLPIGISRDSVDAWIHPELFHMDSQAGAPPDFFSKDGQNWGFPTYNWEKMAEDGYAWWKKRMHRMQEYFDCFRIDHILGFFRIWEIPLPYRSGLMGHFNPALPYSKKELEKLGFRIDSLTAFSAWDSGKAETADVLFLEDPHRKGWYHLRISGKETAVYQSLPQEQKETYDRLYEDFFYHRHDAFWKKSGMKKLPALLSSTGMLACGEDLGMIPQCVPEVMRDLRILSLEIQRMPKKYGEEFANPAEYPYLSVCATGTHDTSTLRSWWKEDKAVTQRFYNSILRCEGDAPEDCGPLICEKIVKQHLASPSMLCILPLQDWLSLDEDLRYPGNPDDERINVPAISHFYWKYRMHLNLEDLARDKSFCAYLREFTEASGRNI